MSAHLRYLNPYDLHKLIINDYILKKPGDTRLLQRDTSKDKTDYDVIRENHKFLWEDGNATTWGEQLAKKYYDKLFKEYCIGDLRKYKENKIALRWRTEKEVINGKGQFVCGNKRCEEEDSLRTWEVNFKYQEQGEAKNALVKIRLCPDCSLKLNFHSKKREIKRLKGKSKTRPGKSKEKHRKDSESGSEVQTVPDSFEESSGNTPEEIIECESTTTKESPWESQPPVLDQKTREDEMEEYLEDLLL